jgi:hypothetical protein
MGATALTVFAVGALVIALGREKHAAEFGVIANADERSSMGR